jgi:hypothetical protein
VRKVVERAKGILQQDLRLTEEAAYQMLRRESQQRRKSMKDVPRPSSSVTPSSRAEEPSNQQSASSGLGVKPACAG